MNARAFIHPDGVIPKTRVFSSGARDLACGGTVPLLQTAVV